MGPTLDTARLTLRLPREEDLDGWADLMADEQAAQFIGGPIPRSGAWRAMATMAGSWSLKGFGMFSVIEKSSGEWIGRVGPWRPEGWPGPEVGWALRKSAWGKGYAREAAEAAIDWVFETLDWSEVIHTIDPANVSSQRLAMALGAVNAGPTRLPPPLENFPVELWRQSREDWRARSPT
ncbi:MAG: GNAT family N-acetyltransferase [Porphyrobacter sp.]|nr:GNAT family N-acetyltransferase [Porphyrobacter sp.]